MRNVRWRVEIPAPSAKRMAGSGKLFIQTGNGWCGGLKKQLPLQPDQTSAEFEVNESLEWLGAMTCRDGAYFEVWIEYSNSTGSRKSTIRLVPQKVGT